VVGADAGEVGHEHACLTRDVPYQDFALGNSQPVEADREHDHVDLVLATVAEPQPVGVIFATGLSPKLIRTTASRLYASK
jgi:hypothetical protein